MITAGAQQAIDLIARLLLNPGDVVWVEECGFVPARAAFAGVGARAVEIPVDHEGLDVCSGQQLAPDARLALVTPSFAAPFGAAMSLRRRIALLEWAHREGAWIIEDDYNGELSYDGGALPALQGFEHPGSRRVIYIRTFSRTLFPALRLGYVVLPPELIDAYTRLRTTTDRHSPTAEQAVLADFIAQGHFARHVRDMRSFYAARQRAFLVSAASVLGELLRFHPASAGLHLVGWLPQTICDQQVTAEAARRGVIVEPLSRRRLSRPGDPGLILGYAAFDEATTGSALSQLAAAIYTVRNNRGVAEHKWLT